MSYDNQPAINSTRIDYGYGAVSFASAGTVTKYLQGPVGRRGRLDMVTMAVSTTMVGVSTPNLVNVGIVGTLSKFGSFPISNATYATGLLPSANVVVFDVNVPIQVPPTPTTGFFTNYPQTVSGYNSGDSAWLFIPNDTVITVSFVSQTGASAGVADVVVSITWI